METQSPDSPQYRFLLNRFEDAYLYDVNRDVFNQFGSDTLFQRHFGKAFAKEDKLNVIVGTDSGLLVRYVHRMGPPAGSRFLFVELPSLVPTIEAQLADLDLGEKIAITTPDKWAEYREPWAFQDYCFLEGLKVFQSLAAMDAFLPEYRPVYRDIRGDIDTFTWQVQFQMGSQAFVERQIENLAEDQHPAICLKDSFKGETAVLLGGGPSLDDMLPWIKANRDKLVVMAVSRVSRRLLMEDLQPDIVVSIDPHPVSFDVSKEMLRFNPDVLLINSHHITPLLLGQWPGRNVYLGPRAPWESGFNDDNLAASGPTVTNTTLGAALDMGFSRVILAGVDLCYTRSGNTYAEGSNERAVGPFFGAIGVQVETNGGWMADTRHSFATAVELMGQQAALAEQRGCQVINPAAGAAKIPNVEHIPLEQIELPAEGIHAGQRLADALPASGPQQTRAYYEKVRKELARVNGRLRKIRTLAEDALHCNDGLFGRNGIKADFKYKKRMDKIERRLDREFKDLSPLVKQFGSRSFLKLVRPDRSKEWSDEDIEVWGRAYYESYRESANHLLDLIKAAQERLADRIEELAEQPDIERLIKRWRDDQQPNRASLWLQRTGRTTEQLNDPQRAAFAELAQQFEDIIAQRETPHLERCKDEFSLAPVRSKLIISFQNSEQDELQHLAEGLQKIDSTEAQELHHLARGYLLELQDNLTDAFAAYNDVTTIALQEIEQAGEDRVISNPRLEDALRRMSHIALSLEDTQNALLVMDSLAALSPVYEPQYAELLRLTNDIEGAINVYTDYLTKVPSDLSTMLRLGKLYMDHGANESAQWAFNYVIEQDPNNEAARSLLRELEARA